MNRFVTLKRVPTAAEWERFNISSYPHSMDEIKSSSMWRKIQLTNEKAHASRKMNTFGDMVTKLGSKGESIMDQIFTVTPLKPDIISPLTLFCNRML